MPSPIARMMVVGFQNQVANGSSEVTLWFSLVGVAVVLPPRRFQQFQGVAVQLPPQHRFQIKSPTTRLKSRFCFSGATPCTGRRRGPPLPNAIVSCRSRTPAASADCRSDKSNVVVPATDRNTWANPSISSDMSRPSILRTVSLRSDVLLDTYGHGVWGFAIFAQPAARQSGIPISPYSIGRYEKCRRCRRQTGLSEPWGQEGQLPPFAPCPLPLCPQR